MRVSVALVQGPPGTGKTSTALHILQQWVHNVIDRAEVVCCTSIGAGSAMLNDYTFPRVLMDEASQATEPATIVPICKGCGQLVLLGDHCQLPPTVPSDLAS